MDSSALSALRDALELMPRLLDRGVPLADALQVAASASRSMRIRALLEAMRESYRRDRNILSPMETHKDLIPQTVFWLTSSGFIGGQLAAAWRQASDVLEAALELPVTLSGPKLFFRRQTVFARQLACLLEGGVHMVSALHALESDEGPGAFRQALGEMASKAREGQSIAPLMAESPDLFSADFAKEVAAGETGGDLAERLRHFSRRLTRQLGRL